MVIHHESCDESLEYSSRAFAFPTEIMWTCQDIPSSPRFRIHSVRIVYAILSKRPPCGKNILSSDIAIVHSKFTPGVTGEKGGDAVTVWSTRR